MTPDVGPSPLVAERRARLAEVMTAVDVSAILTADPVAIRYATGTRNMVIHGFTGPDRVAMVFADGPTVLWEFAGCEHLSSGAPFVDEVRPVPALSAKKRPDHALEQQGFAGQIAELMRAHAGAAGPLAVDGLDGALANALRAAGIRIADGNGDGVAVMQRAMAIKQPLEIAAMRKAMRITQEAALEMQAAIEPGRTEQEVWAEFHRGLIARGGEFIVTRLLQAGERTFPYFREASANSMRRGDLVCFDSDAVAAQGYSADYSRTFLCGDAEPTSSQRALHRLALDQLRHNGANLESGRSFESFAAAAFEVPEPHARYGYYQLAHGLGMLGGHPNIPRIGAGPYPLDGGFEPGMVICIESYVGCAESAQGVKLEDQFLVTDDGVERMSTHPFDSALTEEA